MFLQRVPPKYGSNALLKIDRLLLWVDSLSLFLVFSSSLVRASSSLNSSSAAVLKSSPSATRGSPFFCFRIRSTYQSLAALRAVARLSFFRDIRGRFALMRRPLD